MFSTISPTSKTCYPSDTCSFVKKKKKNEAFPHTMSTSFSAAIFTPLLTDKQTNKKKKESSKELRKVRDNEGERSLKNEELDQITCLNISLISICLLHGTQQHPRKLLSLFSFFDMI